MALQEQIVPVEISTGIDTKTDPKKVTGKLISLINAVFHESRALLKRFGYASLPQTILNGSSIARGATLSPYQSELVALDGKNLYSYSDDQSSWITKGSSVSCTFSTNSIVKNSRGQLTQDQAIHPAGFQVFTWEDSAGGSNYSVIDTGTGQTIINNAVISSTGYMAKPLVVGNYIVILYYDTATTSLTYKAINMSTVTSIGSAVVVVGSPNLFSVPVNTCIYDATVINNVIHIVFGNTTGITCLTLSSSLALATARTITITNSVLNLAVFGDASNNAWISYRQTSGGLFLTVYSFQFASLVLASTGIDNSANFTTLHNLTGIVIGTTGYLFYESDQLALFVAGTIQTFYGDYILSNTCTISGTVGTPYTVIRSLGLASKPFVYNSTIYMLTVYDAKRTSAQPGIVYDVSSESTYFVVDSLGNIITKVAQLNGGGVTAKPILPEALTVSSVSFQLSYLFKDLLVSENNNVFTQTGVQSLILNFATAYPSKLEIGEALLLGGGVFQQYDGASPTEQNFHVYPELMTAWVGQIGGALSVGSYEYESIYGWTDNQGQTNRSGTSDPLVVANTVFQVSASTTSGSGVIKINPPQSSLSTFPAGFFNMDNGFLVTGPGIPAGAFVTSRSITGGPVSYNVSLSANATATASEVNLTLTPLFSMTGSIDDLSRSMVVSATPYLPTSIYGPPQSALAYASDLTNIAVGMSVIQSITGSSAPQLITSIDSVSHLLGGVATNGSGVPQVVEIYKQFTGTFSSSSNVVTSVNSYIFPLLNVGDSFITADANIYKISSFNATAQTITMTLLSATTTTQTANVYFPASVFIRPGQVISGSGIPANTLVRSVMTGSNVPTAPNQATTITLSAPATSTQITQPYNFTNLYSINLQIPTLRATSKSSVSIIPYRTTSNGTLLYRISSVANPIISNKTDDFAYVADVISDYSILGNEQLYTTGGEVDNSSPPSSNVITTYKNRAVLIPNENPLSWWYSKQVIPGSPVEFSNNFVENIDSRGGGITAPAAMDDKLVLFKSSNIFYVVGEGPTPAGTQNDFTEAQLISSDVGCTNPASIVLMPDGLMFQSSKGIYLLSRGMSVMYIGADVEAYNSDTVTSAVLMQSLNQVRFTMLSGVCLVYDYYFKQWAVFTNIAAVDACIYNGIYNYLTSAGLVNAETTGYTDNGAFIQLSLTTSWMSLASLQGFQRVWRMVVLGQYKSPHNLLVNVNTDFNGATNVQNETVSVTSDPGLYEYRFHMKQQKCTSIQFQIQDSQSSSFGEGMQLSEITLEVGSKVGTNKLSAGKTY